MMAGGHGLIDGMRQALPALNPAERRVAQAVLRDISAATRLTTQDLSSLAAVSEPTVVRFARRMGSKGFAHSDKPTGGGRWFRVAAHDSVLHVWTSGNRGGGIGPP